MSEGTEVTTLKQQIQEHPTYQKSLLVREAAKQMQSKAWGQALTPAERNAIAAYAVELDVDPVKHIDMLGGKPYLNAECYFDKAAVALPTSSTDTENISDNADARLKWGVPDCAIAVYVIRVWRDAARRDSGLAPDVTEIGYAPKTDRVASSGKKLDSIGYEEPHKTARTRGLRRALRVITPIWSQRAEAIERKIALLHAQAKEIAAVEGPKMVGSVALPDDPYAVGPGVEPARLIAGDSQDNVEAIQGDSQDHIHQEESPWEG